MRHLDPRFSGSVISIRHFQDASSRPKRAVRSGEVPAFALALSFVCHSERSEESPHWPLQGYQTRVNRMLREWMLKDLEGR
jgi:hypothetical protein